MELNQILAKIDDIKAKLDAAPSFTEGELERFREQFMVEYTYDSNAIEGNTLTLEETALVVLEGLTINKKPLKCHLEAIGHRDAFAYVVEIAKEYEKLTEMTIKDIHSLVLMDRPLDRGKYRDVQVVIRGALDTLPSPMQVPIKMESLLKEYASDTRHPIVKIADFHILFERIHPFIDGNGRTGRLIMNLELIKAGYAPVNIKFKDRDSYIACFNDYVTRGDSSKFIEMVAVYELEEIERIYSILQEKLAVQKYKEENGLTCKPTVVGQMLDAVKAKSESTASLTEMPTMNTAETPQEEKDKAFCALCGILEGHDVDLDKEREERISPITSKITQ